MASMTLRTNIRMRPDEIGLRKQLSIGWMAIQSSPRAALFSTKSAKIFLQKILDRKTLHVEHVKIFEQAKKVAQYLFFGIQLISHVVISDKPIRVNPLRDQSVRKFI
jgi:hypothetical protein